MLADPIPVTRVVEHDPGPAAGHVAIVVELAVDRSLAGEVLPFLEEEAVRRRQRPGDTAQAKDGQRAEDRFVGVQQRHVCDDIRVQPAIAEECRQAQ